MDYNANLICAYSPGMFSVYYKVQFTSNGQKSCDVNKHDLTKIDDNSGQVRVRVLETNQDIALIAINDCTNQRISQYKVPLDDLVFD